MSAKIFIVSSVLAILLAAGVVAENTAPSGRDVAREGAIADVTGTLQYQDNEWYLDDGGNLNELHMGVLGHEGELPFSNGATAEIHGFVIPDHIAPIRVITDGQTVEFWNPDGYPQWAGSGDRRNAVDPDSGSRANAADDGAERGYRNQDLRTGRGR